MTDDKTRESGGADVRLNLQHARWYWLQLDGPDGRVSMLGRWSSRLGGFNFPSEGSHYLRLDPDGLIHKWMVIEAEEVARPSWEAS